MERRIATEIIATHNLKVGDPMKDIVGDDIPNSIVLGQRIALLSENDSDGGGYRLISEPIFGNKVDIRLSSEAVAAIRSSNF